MAASEHESSWRDNAAIKPDFQWMSHLDPPSEPDPEPMQYGMIGDDMMSDQEKIEKYSGEVTWEYLRPHFEKEALVWVDPSLDLATVGQAFADDDNSTVSDWKKSGDLVVPGPPHAAHWAETDATFKAAVVQPFILIQPLPEEKS